MLLSSAVKIVQSGDNIRNAQKEVLDTNFEPKIGLLLYILYQGSSGIYQGKCLTLTGYQTGL